MYLRTLSPQKSLGPQIANPQITNLQITKKIESANRKPSKGHICGRSANLINYVSPQMCGIADLRFVELTSSKWIKIVIIARRD
jgi:hypothetical protein